MKMIMHLKKSINIYTNQSRHTLKRTFILTDTTKYNMYFWSDNKFKFYRYYKYRNSKGKMFKQFIISIEVFYYETTQ